MSRTFALALVLCVGAGRSAGAASEQILADSVRDFSGTQGEKNWYYGHYNGDGQGAGDGIEPRGAYTDDDFGEATFSGDRWKADYDWLLLYKDSCHPSSVGTQGVWVVRRWVSGANGRVAISGSANRHTDMPGTVKFHILVDGTEVFGRKLGSEGGGDKLVQFDLTVPVHAGSRVDFAVDCDGATMHDSTRMDVVVRLVSGSVAATGVVIRQAGEYYVRPNDTILLLGDATTADGRYWRRVLDDLRAEYPALGDPAAVTVVNAGEALETAARGLAKIDELLARHRPTVAVVCYGVSDAITGSPTSDSDLRALVARLLASRVAVTLVAPPCPDPKRFPELAGYAAALERVAADLAAIAREKGCRFADAFALSRSDGDEDWSWGDGVHPGDRGHRLMARSLHEAWEFGKPIAKE